MSLVMLVLGLSFGADAFTLISSTNPQMQGWASPEIVLLVNSSGCPAGVDVVGLIEEAAKVWNNVPTSSVKVSVGGTTTSTGLSAPTTVYCEPNFQTVTGADQNYVPGAATSNTSTGRITAGLLVLNASGGTGNIANFDRTKLLIIVAHEIGHVLGLGHSATPKALMYYDATARMKLSLGQDDMDGVAYLYPVDELKDGKIMGCGRVGNVSHEPPGPMGALVLLLPFVLLLFGRIHQSKDPERLRFG